MTAPHISVLLNEVLQAFEPLHIQYFLDGTLGAGGHAEAILKAHPEIKAYIGMDQDPLAIEIASKRLSPWKEKLRLIPKNFVHLSSALSELGVSQLNGILLDLGVSSMQFDLPERGFSFTHNGPLDMRMNPNGPLTAADIVNTWSEKDLGYIFREYGEEKQWRKAANAICEGRKLGWIGTTHDLAELLRPLFSWKKKGINPLTLIFQALRIAVNGELDVLEKTLSQALESLTPGGRLAVISFHSLEDRIVKNFIRFACSDKMDTSGLSGLFLDKEPTMKMVSKKPIAPGEDEVKSNPRSRSAKLRVAEKR